MRGRAIPYSAAEMAWLDANRAMVVGAWHAAFQRHFARPDVAPANLAALRKRQGWATGRTGRFVAGQPAVNKGVPCPAGRGGRHPNARATQFAAGSRSGRAAERYKPIGTERLTKEGYRQRKVHDGLPLQSRWQLVQRIEWIAANGPIPEGHALKCLNGDKQDTSTANWQPVPRGVLARLNGGPHRKNIAYDAAPAELKPTVMALATLSHAAYCRRAGQ